MTISNLKDFFINFVGPYTPDLTQGLEGIAQLDWVWIAGAALALMMVGLFFKMIKSILKDLFRGWFVS